MGQPAIIAHEKHQRFFADALGLQLFHQFANGDIHFADHGGMDAAIFFLDMAIFLHRVARGLIRQVGSTKGEIEKQRLFLVARADHPQGLIGQ